MGGGNHGSAGTTDTATLNRTYAHQQLRRNLYTIYELYIHLYIYMYIHTYIHTYIHIYIYIYISALTSNSNINKKRSRSQSNLQSGRLRGAKPKPQTPSPKPKTPSPKPQAPSPKPQAPNPKPQALNPKPFLGWPRVDALRGRLSSMSSSCVGSSASGTSRRVDGSFPAQTPMIPQTLSLLNPKP